MGVKVCGLTISLNTWYDIQNSRSNQETSKHLAKVVKYVHMYMYHIVTYIVKCLVAGFKILNFQIWELGKRQMF